MIYFSSFGANHSNANVHLFIFFIIHTLLDFIACSVAWILHVRCIPKFLQTRINVCKNALVCNKFRRLCVFANSKWSAAKFSRNRVLESLCSEYVPVFVNILSPSNIDVGWSTQTILDLCEYWQRASNSPHKSGLWIVSHKGKIQYLVIYAPFPSTWGW